MDKLPILGKLRRSDPKDETLSGEEFEKRYHHVLNEFALGYPITRNDEQTDRMRGIPAREQFNRETKEKDIIPLVDPEEVVYDISSKTLRELIEKARTNSPLSEFITKTMKTPADHIFGMLGVCDIIHLASLTPSSEEQRFIRHTVHSANPNGGGIVYIPNKNLALQGATVGERVEGNLSPEEWLIQLSETPMPGFAQPIYQENPEYPRRLVSDTIYSPDPQADIISEGYDGPLFLILKNTQIK